MLCVTITASYISYCWLCKIVILSVPGFQEPYFKEIHFPFVNPFFIKLGTAGHKTNSH